MGWCGTYLLSKFGFEGGWRGATCVSSLAIIESGVGAALEDGCVGAVRCLSRRQLRRERTRRRKVAIRLRCACLAVAVAVHVSALSPT